MESFIIMVRALYNDSLKSSRKFALANNIRSVWVVVSSHHHSTFIPLARPPISSHCPPLDKHIHTPTQMNIAQRIYYKKKEHVKNVNEYYKIQLKFPILIKRVLFFLLPSLAALQAETMCIVLNRATVYGKICYKNISVYQGDLSHLFKRLISNEKMP